MPEGLEAEIYRRSVESCIGRRIVQVDIDERQPHAAEFPVALSGRVVAGARRHGKFVLVDLVTDSELSVATFGLHFGMTGRVIVDDVAPIDELAYGSGRDKSAWDRLSITFDDGGMLRVNDPRRWAKFTLDPDTARLGPDFLNVAPAELADAFSRRRAAIKTVLLNQAVVAGYGNLCVDELLWQFGISPLTPASELSREMVDVFAKPARTVLRSMLSRGGSHRGVISPEIRTTVPECPRGCGPLRREQVGNRTTIWCPEHQLAKW